MDALRNRSGGISFEAHCVDRGETNRGPFRTREVFTSNLMRFAHVITDFAMTLDEFLTAKMHVPNDMVQPKPYPNLISQPKLYPPTETLPRCTCRMM